MTANYALLGGPIKIDPTDFDASHLRALGAEALAARLARAVAMIAGAAR